MLLLLLLLLLLLPLLTLLEHASPVRLCFYEPHDVVTNGALQLVANLVALIDQRHHLNMYKHTQQLCITHGHTQQLLVRPAPTL
jgi:hypothetical protein